MVIVSNQSWSESDGVWRKIGVSLGWQDLVRLLVEKKVKGYHLDDTDLDNLQVLNDAGEQMPTLLMYRILQAQADLLLIQQMYNERAFGPVGDPQTMVNVKEQIVEVRARVPELS